MEKSKIYKLFSEYLIRRFESENTIKIYSNFGYRFIYESHPDTIEKLSNYYLVSYVTEIKKVSVSKYNQFLSVLKHLYNNVLNQEKKLRNVYPVKIHPKLVSLPDYHEVKGKILNIGNLKHRAILLTLLTTGLRISELLNLKIEDVDSKNLKLLVKNGKGGVSNFVLITNELLKLLRDYYRKERPKEYLFEGINGKYSKTSVTKLVKKYIGQKYSPHWLRKVAITYVINKNISMPKAKLFSRHKADSSIHYYYSYDNNTFNELREILAS